MLIDKSLSGPQDLDQKPSIPCPRQLNPTTVNDYEVRKCLDTYKLSALVTNINQKIVQKTQRQMSVGLISYFSFFCILAE